MGKNPAYLHFPLDFDRDLKPHGPEVAGAWQFVLNHLHFCQPRGTDSLPLFSWARIMSTDKKTAERIIHILDNYKIADVQWDKHGTDHGTVTLVSRRMSAEDKDKEKEKLRKRRYRVSRECPADVPSTSSVSVSSQNPTPPPSGERARVAKGVPERPRSDQNRILLSALGEDLHTAFTNQPTTELDAAVIRVFQLALYGEKPREQERRLCVLRDAGEIQAIGKAAVAFLGKDISTIKNPWAYFESLVRNGVEAKEKGLPPDGITSTALKETDFALWKETDEYQSRNANVDFQTSLRMVKRRRERDAESGT